MSEGYELIEREAKSTLDMARELVVHNDEQYSEAGQFVADCKSLIAKIKDDFKEPKRKADEAHKAITAMEKRMLEPVVMAMDLASRVALDYKREQDRLAREEAEAIEREIRRKVEEERLKEAERLEAEGKNEEAEKVIEAPIEAPRPVRFESAVPKIPGLSARGTWKGRVINQRLVKREFCLADQTLINMHVNRFWPKGTPLEKKTLTDDQRKMLEDEVGGIEIYLDDSFAGARRA